MRQPRTAARSWVLVVVLVAVLSGCKGEPQRYGDYQDDDSGSGADQCDVPVSERTGGWVCPAG